MILVDTGPLVAIADEDSQWHQACIDALFSTRVSLLVPATVVAEVCYLLDRDAGPKVEAQFLRSFEEGFLNIVDLTTVDLSRAAELVEEYADLPLGGTDASLVAISERLGVKDVATLDIRHFSVVRPKHVEYFNLLPTRVDYDD